MDNGLGQGLLNDPVITKIATDHGKTSAQILLRWNVQRGVGVIPKSSKFERIQENFDLEFVLSDAEVSCS